MTLYCRFLFQFYCIFPVKTPQKQVGHTVLETETAYNGAKEPKWGKTFYATLPRGVDSFSLEIFDEKSFKTDERIAWNLIRIPERVIQGETVDDWYPLSGKQVCPSPCVDSL